MDTTTGSTPHYGKQQTMKTGTLGQGHLKPDHNRQKKDSRGWPAQANQTKDNTRPLTIVAANMTEDDIDRAIKSAREASTEIHIRDSNGKVFQNNIENPTRGEKEEEIGKIDETSDLELLSNLSSSTEIEQETKEHNLRRSKRLTKTTQS